MKENGSLIGTGGIGICCLKGTLDSAQALKGQHRITEIFAKPFAHCGFVAPHRLPTPNLREKPFNYQAYLLANCLAAFSFVDD